MSLTDQSRFIPFAQQLVEQWHLQPQGEFLHTHSSLLCHVKFNEQDAILKIVNPDDDETHSGQILKYFNGQGAVKLLKAYKNAFLLEHIQTDKRKMNLEQMVLKGEIEQATHILCDAIDLLHIPRETEIPKQTTPFTSRFEDMRKHLNEGRVPHLRRKECEESLSLTQELTQAYKNENTLLHGDIHHFNVLHDKNRGWLAFDPKGFYGPKPYEYASLFCNPYRHQDIVTTRHYVETLTAIIAERSGFSKETITKFAYIHSMQCAAWSLSQPDQEYWFACAGAIKEYAEI